MPKKAHIYVASVILLGVVTLGMALSQWTVTDLPRLAWFVALTMVASAVKFRLPGITGTYSLNSIFLLAGVVYYSLEEVLLAACGAALVQSLAHAKKRPTALQIAFNAAGEVISVAVGYFCLHLLTARGILPEQPAFMAVGAAVYFALNTGMVSGVLALLEGKPLGEVNQQWYYWPFPYYLLGASVVGVLPLNGHSPRPEAWILLLPVAYLLHFFWGVANRQEEPAAAGGQSAEGLSGAAKAYAALVALGGAALLGVGLLNWQSSNPGEFLSLLGLALLTATWKVRFPGLQGSISVNYVMVLVAALHLGFAETMVIACVGPLVQSLWKPARKPTVVQVGFNMAVQGISLAVAFGLCRVLFADYLGTSLVLSLAAITVVQYLVNTLLVARMISLVEKQSLVSLWHRCYFWSFPYYLVGAAAAGVMATANQAAGWAASLAVVPLMALIYFSYKLHLEKRVVVAPAAK